MKTRMDRRTILRGMASGAAAAGLTTLLSNTVHALSPMMDKKLLIIFQRGANDALNTIVPTGAAAQAGANSLFSEYTGLRPNIHLSPSSSGATHAALPLMRGGSAHSTAELNPALARLSSIYQNGDLAMIHRVGSLGLTLSHFTAQHHWETGRPLDLTLASNAATNYNRGWVTRLTGNGPFVSASLSDRQQQFFDSTVDIEAGSHIRRLFGTAGVTTGYSYKKAGPAGPHSGLENLLPLGISAQAGSTAPTLSPMDARIRAISTKAVLSENQVASQVGTSYTPLPGASYPKASASPTNSPDDLPNAAWVTEFGDRLKDAAALLKNTSVQVVGVELGGWDTHAAQVFSNAADNAFGLHQQRLAVLAAGMEAIYQDVHLDTAPGRPDVVTLVVTEFGRTVKENSSRGTDHGWSTGAMVMNTNLSASAPRVFNFDVNDPDLFRQLRPGDLTDGNAAFAPAPTDPARDLYMLHRTDFRAVLREILETHFGIPTTGTGGNTVNDILPGVIDEQARWVPPFDQAFQTLGFL